MKTEKWLFFIMFFGLLLRVSLIIAGDYSFTTWENHEMAVNFIHGEGLATKSNGGITYYSFYPGIFYTLFTSVFYFLFGIEYGQIVLLFFQYVLTCINAFLVFLIVRKVFNKPAALIASFLVVTHPALLYYDVKNLHPLGFDSLWYTLFFFLMLRLLDTPKPVNAIISGIALGVAFLQRGALVLMPLLSIVLLYFNIKNKKRFYKLSLLFLVGFLLLISPWMLRNYMIHDSIVITTIMGEHFWRGNVPWSYGGSYTLEGKTVISSAPKEFHEKLSSIDTEIEQHNFFLEDAFRYITADPFIFLKKTARKFTYFWSFAPTSGLNYPALYFYVYQVYYLLLLVFCVITEINFIRNKQLINTSLKQYFLLLLFLFVSVSLIFSFFYLEMRHRWALEPLLISLASPGIYLTVNTLKKRFWNNENFKFRISNA